MKTTSHTLSLLLLLLSASVAALAQGSPTGVWKACEGGNLEAVRLYLDDLNDPDKPLGDVLAEFDDRTLLYFAVVNGHFDIIQLLLENGADPNIRIGVYVDPNGTCLNFALWQYVFTKNPNYEIPELLLKHGADIDFRGHEKDIPCDQSPLQTAIYKRDYKAAKWLFSHGAKGITYFDVASIREDGFYCRTGRWDGFGGVQYADEPDFVELMIQYNIEGINAHKGVIDRGTGNLYPLDVAILHGLKKTSLLMVEIADLSIIYEKGNNTALHLLAQTGDFVTMKKALEMGADPNALNGDSNSPLLIVGKSNGWEDRVNRLVNYRLVRILLSGGANPYLKNTFGKRPIDFFASKHRLGSIDRFYHLFGEFIQFRLIQQSSAVSGSGNVDAKFKIEGFPGQSFVLLYSDNLADWSEVTTITLESESTVYSQNNLAGNTSHFFKLKINQ